VQRDGRCAGPHLHVHVHVHVIVHVHVHVHTCMLTSRCVHVHLLHPATRSGCTLTCVHAHTRAHAHGHAHSYTHASLHRWSSGLHSTPSPHPHRRDTPLDGGAASTTIYSSNIAHRSRGPPCHAGRLGLPFGVRAAEPSRPANPSHSRRTRLILSNQSSTPREFLRGEICRGRPPFNISTSPRRRLCCTAWASGGDRTQTSSIGSELIASSR